MDCVSFRRRILEDPFDSAAAEHEHNCPSCAKFAREVRNRDHALRQVLEVDPPAGMNERIQLAISFDQQQNRRGRPWLLSAAAGLLIAITAVSLNLLFNPLDSGNSALAKAVIHHIEDESHHLHEPGPVNDAHIRLVFARVGAQFKGGVGRVNFAAICLMRDKIGVHLVLPGDNGPITVFYMPDEMTDKTLKVADKRFRGKVVPTVWGSVAVVGERGEQLEEVTERLLAAAYWPESRIGQRRPEDNDVHHGPVPSFTTNRRSSI